MNDNPRPTFEFRPVPPAKHDRRRILVLGGAAALLAGGVAKVLQLVVPNLTEPPPPLAASASASTSTSTAPLVEAASAPISPTQVLPTPLPTLAPSPTAAPAAVVLAPAATAQPPLAPTAAPTETVAAATEVDAQPTAATLLRTTAIAKELDWFEIGTSVEGRSIAAIRIGTGPVHLAIMGAIHGGWEKNTMTLVQQAYDYFNDNSDLIQPQLSVYFVPATNPDGIAVGTNSDAAWNAHGVDLNRNFDSYNWSRDTFGLVGGRYGPTGTKKNGGGPRPFSEPETQAVKRFIEGKSIDAVLSYHSGIVSVTAKDGGGGVGEPLAEEVATITGYGYIAKWTLYKLTGQFMDWLDDKNVKGVEIELPDQHTLDWAKNLKSMKAVMQTLAEG